MPDDWKTNPRIQAAKAIAKQFQYEGVIVLAKRPDGGWDGFSYGKDGKVCKEMGDLMDNAVQQIEVRDILG